jgi:hypothetical protein
VVSLSQGSWSELISVSTSLLLQAVDSMLINRYCEVTQTCDAMIIDLESKAYHQGYLVSSILFIVLCWNLKILPRTDLKEFACGNTRQIIENGGGLSLAFGNFLRGCFRIEIDELVPYIKFCLSHMEMSYNYSISKTPSIDSYSEVLSMHIYNPNVLPLSLALLSSRS